MSPTVYAISLPVLVILLYLFLIFRLSFFKGKEISGRYLFLTGGLLVLAAAVWQGISTTDAYTNWFLSSAYPIIELIHLLIKVFSLFTSEFTGLWKEFLESVQHVGRIELRIMDLCDLHFNYNRKNYKVSVLNEMWAVVFNNINKIREKNKGRKKSVQIRKKRRLWF